MAAMRVLRNGIPFGLLSMILLCGCGTSESSTTPSPENANAASGSSATGNSSDALTASISGPSSGEAAENLESEPEKGTAEWCLLEIVKVRNTPISTDHTAAEIAKVRAERHHKIVELATDAIDRLMKEPAKQELFDEAIKQLMDAQLELALVDPEEIDALYTSRDLIFKRNPKSKAAAEASFAVARFTHTRARDFAKQHPESLQEFAEQAISFAKNFPQEEVRAVQLLYSAGSSCEARGLRDDAVACYTLLREEFPKSPQGQQIVAVLRRMQLEGKPVELAGETLGGGYLSIDKYAGKPVVVVFWSSDNQACQALLPKLVEATQKYENRGLSLIGVNLDDDQGVLETYLKEQRWEWPQLFDSSTSKRRWKNDVVKYYGVRNIPLVWLIDANGVVVNAQVDPADLEELVQPLFAIKGESKGAPKGSKSANAKSAKKKVR